MRYKNSDLSSAEIAGELGVDAVVEGSALRVGDSVRIMAQLIDPETEQALWAESYERDLENVLVLQGDVAQAIAGELAVALTPEETRLLAGARAVNPEAHDAYLKGSYHWKTLTPEGLDTAQRYFELALEKDPSYSPAYAGLAWVWADRQQFGLVPPHEAGPKAIAAALKAVELDDGSAGAHEAMAVVRTWTQWDWAGAEKEFRRALEIDPKAASTHAYFAHLLAITGRIEEAIPHSERALALDPFNALFHALYAAVLYHDRRYDEAIATARNGLAIQPSMPLARNVLRGSLFAKGLRDEWLANQRARIARDPELLAAFDQGLAEAGHEGAYRRLGDIMAARLEDSGGIVAPGGLQSLYVAKHYLYAGDIERAMDWIERAHEARDPNLPYVGVEPIWDPLHSDPRFLALLRKMNLPTTDAAGAP
jgi:tetratricopeptide (TPR) repeat protein